ncbi:hypothetical protein A3709_10920 [Halioglobus sp. HI00S01]|nr:hypothetical protein A3709_10920 [Halioglobus sp. HI00S01]
MHKLRNLLLRRLHVGIWHIGGESFKQYVLEQNTPQKLRELLRGLDKDSQDTVNLFLSRAIQLPDKKSLDFFVDRKSRNKYPLKTKAELHDHSEILAEYRKNRSHILKKYRIDPYIWHYQHGLRHLPQSVHAYIKDKTFLDLGAYTGDSAYVLANFRPMSIMSFEISTRHIDSYIKLTSLTDISDVRLFHVALSDSSGTFTFDDSGTEGNSIFKPGESVVEKQRLDDFILEHTAADVGLIKADIEGDELKFLLGAKETICRVRPVLLISIYHNPDQFFEVKPLLESWKLDYKFMIRKLSPTSWTAETTLIAYPSELSA